MTESTNPASPDASPDGGDRAADADVAEIRVHVSVVLQREGRLLLVQEGKPSSRGRWNLPGGHLEPRERFLDGACREAREETGLVVDIVSLLGLYSGMLSRRIHSVRVVLHARQVDPAAEPVAGDQILDVRWASVREIVDAADAELLAPAMLRAITRDVSTGRNFPLDVLGGYFDG